MDRQALATVSAMSGGRAAGDRASTSSRRMRRELSGKRGPLKFGSGMMVFRLIMTSCILGAVALIMALGVGPTVHADAAGHKSGGRISGGDFGPCIMSPLFYGC
eukprot:5358-Eustigmatos_ZCMA.PRE.1